MWPHKLILIVCPQDYSHQQLQCLYVHYCVWHFFIFRFSGRPMSLVSSLIRIASLIVMFCFSKPSLLSWAGKRFKFVFCC